MATEFDVVDRVERDTAEMLRDTDAILAWHEDDVLVLARKDE